MTDGNMKDIVDKYGSYIYTTAFAHVHHKEDAEDIFQEVFLTYVKKQPVFKTEEQARAWFLRTTVNHCRHLWRSKSRHPEERLEEETLAFADSKEEMELMDALSRMPVKYRRVLEMFYFTGLTLKEIAQTLRISENAVRIRMSRARKMLRDELGED